MRIPDYTKKGAPSSVGRASLWVRMGATMQNIVILISGRGSNFEAILRTSREEHWETACGARIAAVISNRPLAAGLDIARSAGIDAVCGSIKPGRAADFVVLEPDLTLAATYLAGELVK